MTTIRDALRYGTSMLGHKSVEEQLTSALDIQILLAYVLNVERVTLYTYPERLLNVEQERQFQRLVERRKRGEPVAYLVSSQEFFGLDFLVDKRVLIPRPETELLVEAALKIIRTMLASEQTPIVADIGTGSGAIPITLAVQEPRLAYLYGCDISFAALEVARLNCQQHAVEQRIHLLHGDLLAPLTEPVDILIANLPYVGTAEMEILAPDVRNYEPHLALFSGTQGLDLLYRFFKEAQQPGKLKDGAVILLEIGYRQREPLAHFLRKIWPRARAEFEKDYAGWDRLLKVYT